MTLDFSDYKGWRQKLPTMNTHTQKKQKDKKKKKQSTHPQSNKKNQQNQQQNFRFSLVRTEFKEKNKQIFGSPNHSLWRADKNSRIFRSTVIRIHQCKRHIDAIVSSAPKGDILLLSLLAPEKNNAHPNMKKKNHKKFQTNTLSYLFLFKMTVGVSCVQ